MCDDICACPELDRTYGTNRISLGGQIDAKEVNPPILKILSAYFFIRSRTALVITISPVLIVGSGTGANLLECKLGNGGAPGFLEAAILSGATAPT